MFLSIVYLIGVFICCYIVQNYWKEKRLTGITDDTKKFIFIMFSWFSIICYLIYKNFLK